MRKSITTSGDNVQDNATVNTAVEDAEAQKIKKATKTARAAKRRADARMRAMPTVMEFDKLPDSAFVSTPVVQVLLNCSPATVWRKIKKRVLPEPRHIGSRAVALNVGELRQALRRC